MISIDVELPESIGGKFKCLFPSEGQKELYVKFMKFIATIVIIDGKQI